VPPTRRVRGKPRARLVTLSTDLGWAYAAQMKGVLYTALPPGSVVDLAHDLPAHNVLASAFLVRAMARPFPPGCVHVAVVDPGVGGARAPIAVQCDEGTHLVGPDNGLLSPLAEELGVRTVVRLRPLDAERIGATFDGRDLFAPAAARLATGTALSTLGTPHPLHRLALPRAVRARGSIKGTVLWVDPFGNLITNLPSGWLPAHSTTARVSVGSHPAVAVRVVATYEELSPSELGLLRSSFGLLEVSARERSASRRLGGIQGQPVVVSSSANT
jgi:S-adenosyl-L-methionine hydrolase (adenosine-forming)